MTGKCPPIFPGFQVRVGILLMHTGNEYKAIIDNALFDAFTKCSELDNWAKNVGSAQRWITYQVSFVRIISLEKTTTCKDLFSLERNLWIRIFQCWWHFFLICYLCYFLYILRKSNIYIFWLTGLCAMPDAIVQLVSNVTYLVKQIEYGMHILNFRLFYVLNNFFSEEIFLPSETMLKFTTFLGFRC